MARKVDKRTIAVKNKIRCAIFKMAKEDIKPTVVNLTKTCGINRNTFYLHYKSIDEVYIDIRNSVTKDLIECISQKDVKEIKENPEIFARIIVEVASRNFDLVEYLFQTLDVSNFLIYLVDNISDYLIKEYIEKYGDYNYVRPAIQFMVSGSIYALYKWFKDQGSENIDKLVAQLGYMLDKEINK